MLCCVGLRIKENKEVYEGEVTELTPEETENQVSHCFLVMHSALLQSQRARGQKPCQLSLHMSLLALGLSKL